MSEIYSVKSAIIFHWNPSLNFPRRPSSGVVTRNSRSVVVQTRKYEKLSMFLRTWRQRENGGSNWQYLQPEVMKFVIYIFIITAFYFIGVIFRFRITAENVVNGGNLSAGNRRRRQLCCVKLRKVHMCNMYIIAIITLMNGCSGNKVKLDIACKTLKEVIALKNTACRERYRWWRHRHLDLCFSIKLEQRMKCKMNKSGNKCCKIFTIYFNFTCFFF